MELTDGKQNYKFCVMSDDGKYGAFAQYDGKNYRVYDLDSLQMVKTVTRGNESAYTKSMSLAYDTNDSSTLYLLVTTQKETVHLFIVQGEGQV